LKSGQEPYRLLYYFASLFNDSILIDLGTSNGGSALALSHNKTNQIFSFDIQERSETNYFQNNNTFEKVPRFKNVDFIISENFMKYLDLFLKSSFIYLDIAHDGIWENILLESLKNNNYKGLVIMDDIHEFPEMNKIWNTISFKKFDLTKYGHWSGTGIIDFDNNIELELQ
jgi:predicted O-methyltransferase YrrM